MRSTSLALTGVLTLASATYAADANRFTPALLERPEMRKAFASLDADALIAEWIRVTEIPAPSGNEQARAAYVRGEMEKLGLTDIRSDDMLNLSGRMQGSGGGPTLVLCAHLDTVFPAGTDIRVRRDGNFLRAPGIGDDAAGLVGVLEALRAIKRAGIRPRGDIILLASAQEELGFKGASHWLKTSGVRPDMFVAVDTGSDSLSYGALRIDQYKFHYAAPSLHTLGSRGAPSPARAAGRAISAIYDIVLPPVAADMPGLRLPTINVGMLGGGTVVNATAGDAWFTVDLRSREDVSLLGLREQVLAQARRAADEERVEYRMETLTTTDFAKARPQAERLAHPLVQTALATFNHLRRAGSPVIVPLDTGSTDANGAIALGIPAIAMGVRRGSGAHGLGEYAEADSFVPGIKGLTALVVALTR